MMISISAFHKPSLRERIKRFVFPHELLIWLLKNPKWEKYAPTGGKSFGELLWKCRYDLGRAIEGVDFLTPTYVQL